jgi:ankyrin repeat protein
MNATLNGRAEAMKWLHDQGVELPPVGLLSSSLARAAGRGDIEAMAWLREQGAELHYEMTIEREQGVPVLSKIPLINRAFTNRGMVRDSVSAMDTAAMSGQLEAMKWLRGQGVDVNVNMLPTVAAYGHVEIAVWMIVQVEDVNVKDNWGRTPMFAAANLGLVEAMAWLKERGADVNATESHGMTPMFWAAGGGHIEAMAWLKQHGAEVNVTNCCGGTILSYAKNDEVRTWLLANGAQK